MNRIGVWLTVLFVILVVLQVWIFDKINLFGYATPLLYIYFIMKLPGDMNVNGVMALAALLGLSVDAFEYTLGLNMLPCVVIGFLRNNLLQFLGPRDNYERYVPAFCVMGTGNFLRYAFILTLIHHLILFSIEFASLFDPLTFIFRVIGSIILTMFLIFACESVNFGVFTSEQQSHRLL
jgi:rod shape-determining protein MreD